MILAKLVRIIFISFTKELVLILGPEKGCDILSENKIHIYIIILSKCIAGIMTSQWLLSFSIRYLV